MDPPLRSSYGLHAPFALRTILELKTDSGLTGIAETYGGDGPLAGLEAVRSRAWDLSTESAQEAGAAHGGRSQTYLEQARIRSTGMPGLMPSRSSAWT